MDFPVKATLHLNFFRDEAEVRDILRSHDFVLTDLSGQKLRVKGSFLNLRSVKAHLEKLLTSQAQTKTPLYSPSPVQTTSPGAISKYYPSSSSVSRVGRSRLGSKDSDASPSSLKDPGSWVPDTSHDDCRSSSRTEEQHSFKYRTESFVIDADVSDYASQFRKKDIDVILNCHDVKLEVSKFDDSANITLWGMHPRIAAEKLQSLLNELNKSLRTQEVPHKDLAREGKALLEKIRKNKNIYSLVLVCDMIDGLHLVGPSRESYELKQKLLGRSVDQSGCRGRTFEKNSSRRSTSAPPRNRINTERSRGAVANPSPVGASGYSPSKPGGGASYSPSNYQDYKQEGAKPKWGAGAHLGQSGPSGGGGRRRSCSETREINSAQKANVLMQETEKRGKPPKAPLLHGALLKVNPNNIKKKIKNLKKKKNEQ
ncbi:RNA-binding protein 43 [Echeneis naucrates]|uniref:RNA-binding protein 43 n=1 Tax=Echeneis naucrates TaxID=173247 RepID=UPI0011141383|nr:uncharacterized protein LOC115051149 [Echeneis naucrates]